MLCQELTTEPFFSLTMLHALCPGLGSDHFIRCHTRYQCARPPHPPRRETRAQIQAIFLHTMFRMSLNKDTSGHRVPTASRYVQMFNFLCADTQAHRHTNKRRYTWTNAYAHKILQLHSHVQAVVCLGLSQPTFVPKLDLTVEGSQLQTCERRRA